MSSIISDFAPPLMPIPRMSLMLRECSVCMLCLSGLPYHYAIVYHTILLFVVFPQQIALSFVEKTIFIV